MADLVDVQGETWAAVAVNKGGPIQAVSLVTATGDAATVGGTGASAQQVQGNVAAANADSGNPVKAGGVYNATLPTITETHRGNLQIGLRGALHVQLMGPDSASAVKVVGQSICVRADGVTGTDRSLATSTTSQLIIPASATRSKFYIVNNSGIDVYANPGAAAVAAAGGGNILIPANSGWPGRLEMEGYGSTINIIAASGTPAITAREL